MKTIATFVVVYIRPALLGVALYFLAACASVRIETVPGDAQVLLVVKGKESVKLGKTPVDLQISDLVKTENGNAITIHIEKDGFESSYFGVPNVRFSEIKLVKNLKAVESCRPEHNNEIVSLVLAAEKMISEQRLKEALANVKRIQELDSEVAASYELEGTVQFMNGKFKESYQAWQKALKISPNSSSVKQMLRLTEEKAGIANPKAAPPKANDKTK